MALKPGNITHSEAAGVPLAGLTAWQALFDKGGLKEGQRVLINAGSGGVGTLAIQFAKNAGRGLPPQPASPIRTSSSDLGADQFVDYKAERFEDAVEPCDLVFATNGDQLSEIASLLTGGAVEPVLDSTYPLDDVAEAYRFAQSGGPSGKVAIAIR